MNRFELRNLRKKLGLSRQKFADRLEISIHTLDSWETGKRNIPKTKAALIYNVFNRGNSVDFTFDGQADYKHMGPKDHLSLLQSSKIPYYDTNVVSSVVKSFNDVNDNPTYLIDYPPFRNCTAIINNYGESMLPKFNNGDHLAIKQITNFDVILWGESYLVVTNKKSNNLKAIKDVFQHPEEENKLILRSANPNFTGDTIIEKAHITSMYLVKGKISQFGN